jgi:two-component system, response regulator, stage 0 sporulation protein F
MTNSERIKVLYVDDEEANLFVFKLSFKKELDVLTANSGLLGLNLLQSNPDVTVVISDMRMPVMDGIEFIKQAKAIFPNVTYFLLSGFDLNTQIQNALDLRLISKYFPKPFKKEDVLREIMESVDSKK